MSQSWGEGFPVFDVALLRGECVDESARDAEWERAFSHFQPRLVSYFMRRAEGILPVDDLIQEVWLRAFLNVKSLDSGLALWTWLVTIGTNLLRDELRRNRPIVEPLQDGSADRAQGVAEFMGVSMLVLGDASRDAVEDMRAKLTDDEWEFLNLLCVDNFTHADVARRLGLPTAMSSRQRLRRIRQRLVE